MDVLIGVAWPYASGPRHLGHLAGAYLPADVAARYHRLAGDRVLLVSGSDQHGTPITVAAERAGLSPAALADREHERIAASFVRAGISFDHYTRTATPRHHAVTQELFGHLHRRGLVSEATQPAAFCDREGRPCPTATSRDLPALWGAGRPRRPVRHLRQHPRPRGAGRAALPALRRAGRAAPCASCSSASTCSSRGSLPTWTPTRRAGGRSWAPRPAAGWPPACAPGRSPATWTGACPSPCPAGTTAACTCGSTPSSATCRPRWNGPSWARPEAWRRWWQGPEARHRYFVGKDNIWFHTVWWPAILLGAGQGLRPPDEVVANHHLTLAGGKLSASRGQAPTIEEGIDRVGLDPLRHALCALGPETADVELAWDKVAEVTASGLLGAIAGPPHRVATLLWRRFGGKADPTSLAEAAPERAEAAAAGRRRHRPRPGRTAPGPPFGPRHRPRRQPPPRRHRALAPPRRRSPPRADPPPPLLDALGVAAWPFVPDTAGRVRALLGRPQVPTRWTLDEASGGPRPTGTTATTLRLRTAARTPSASWVASHRGTWQRRVGCGAGEGRHHSPEDLAPAGRGAARMKGVTNSPGGPGAGGSGATQSPLAVEAFGLEAVGDAAQAEAQAGLGRPRGRR